MNKIGKLKTILIMCMCVFGMAGCPSTAQPQTCSATDVAKIEATAEADYSENVAIKCAAYSSLADCPAVPALAAQRDADRKKAEIPCR